MAKTMCKKTSEKRQKVMGKVSKYMCKKCKATAPKKKHLCKGKKI